MSNLESGHLFTFCRGYMMADCLFTNRVAVPTQGADDPSVALFIATGIDRAIVDGEAVAAQLEEMQQG